MKKVMKNLRQSLLFTIAAAVTVGFLVGCRKSPPPPAAPSSSADAATAQPASEQPVPPERNPPGDIPDSQVFISYTSATGHYSIEAPEGWARTEQGAGVTFTDKFDGERVNLSSNAAPPTVASVRGDQVPGLKRAGRAVTIGAVRMNVLPHIGSVVSVIYTSNSDPDPVTGKQVRLENATYYYYQKGALAALTLWAPKGADNVDQWKRISESFRWR